MGFSFIFIFIRARQINGFPCSREFSQSYFSPQSKYYLCTLQGQNVRYDLQKTFQWHFIFRKVNHQSLD